MIRMIGHMNIGKVLIDKILDIHSKIGDEAPAFSEFKSKEIIEKEFHIADLIVSSIEELDKIVIIGSRFPLNYVTYFNTMGIDNITVIDYHPMLNKYKHLINAEIKIKRPLFDDLSKDVYNSDLILFPNSEYLVPLKMLSYYKECKTVMVANHINMQHNFNNYQIKDASVLADDSYLSKSGTFKVGYSTKCYYAYGANISL